MGPALAAGGPAPEGSPQHVTSLRPDPSGGRAPSAAPVVRQQPRTSVTAPRAADTAVKVTPRHARGRAAPVHRRHAGSPASDAPRSSPSQLFNSLTTGVPVPGHAAGTGGIDGRRLLLAAFALLALVVLGGSLLGLAVTQTRSARGA